MKDLNKFCRGTQIRTGIKSSQRTRAAVAPCPDDYFLAKKMNLVNLIFLIVFVKLNPALIVQWIERGPSKPAIGVRLLLRALKNLAVVAQLAELWVVVPVVARSSRVDRPLIFFLLFLFLDRLLCCF